MSSCQNEFSDEEMRNAREEEILASAKNFLRTVATNLCVPEGISGKYDIAFKVDRQKCIAKAMREVADELDKC